MLEVCGPHICCEQPNRCTEGVVALILDCLDQMARFVCEPVDRPERLVSAWAKLHRRINHRAIGVLIENAVAIPVLFR